MNQLKSLFERWCVSSAVALRAGLSHRCADFTVGTSTCLHVLAFLTNHRESIYGGQRRDRGVSPGFIKSILSSWSSSVMQVAEMTK
jgi:hypothetical protein